MALPLDPTGSAVTNKIVNELHNVTLLKDRHFVPVHGVFYVRGLKIYDQATGRLLEPILQYNVLQQNTEAANEVLHEVAQIIHISDMMINKVIIQYQAVGGRYENVSANLNNELELFRTSRVGSVINGVIADEFITLPPRSYLGQLHDHDTGSTLFTQLSDIAEAVESGDPAGQQMSYEYMVNYTNQNRETLETRLNKIQSDITKIDHATRIVDKQYLFTREELNPFIYLDYGTWVKHSNMLFKSTRANNPEFGQTTEVKRGYGLLAVRTMAYQRDDSAAPITYTITPDRTNVNEGESVTFILSAPDIPAGSVLPYILSGVESYDIVGGLLTGNFNVGANGIASTTIEIALDEVTDGEKVMTLMLRTSPGIYAQVTINDTSKETTYQIYYTNDESGNNRVSAINEGETVYMQLRSNITDVPVVVGFDYSDSTVTNADFVQPLPTTLTLTNGAAAYRLDVIEDFQSEGNESLIAGVYSTGHPDRIMARAALLVLDTSRLPSWIGAFYPNASSTTPITQVNEGESFVYRITASNIAVTQPITLSYSGAATADDFTSILPTTGNLLNTLTYAYTTKADQTTDGDEDFIVTAKFNNALITTPPLVNTMRIIDTSLGYGVTDAYMSNDAAGNSRITSAPVPATVYTIVKAVGFANGEMVYIDYSASDQKLRDMLGYNGRTAIVNNGVAYLTNTFNDPNGTITATTTFHASIYRAANGQATGSVLRTMSATINPRLAPEATLLLCGMADFNPITSINEGAKFRLRITTRNIPNGSPALSLTYSGTANAADFAGVRPSSVVVTNNVAIVEYTVNADRLAEGQETCVITVGLPWNGGSVSTSIIINDTSLPIVELMFTSDLAGNSVISQVNEGSTAYMRARTIGYPDNTVLTMIYSGTVSNNDVVGGLPPTMTIVGNTAVAALNIIADETEEGTEQLLVQAKVGNEIVTNGNATLTVNDTSVPGPVRVFWSESTDPNAAVGSLIFNETTKRLAYLHIETKNLPYGTTLQLSYSGTAMADDFDNGLPTTVTTTGQWTRVNYSIKMDILPEPGPNEYLNVSAKYLSRTVTTSQAMIIEDTSYEIELEYPGSSPTTYQAESYGGTTYEIMWGGDLWDYFVSVKGRAPLANEAIRFIIPVGRCIISGDTTDTVVTISDKWNIVGSIAITNRGLWLGLGGGGADGYNGPGYDGKTCFVNKSTKNIAITNYNIIAGGGGGGADLNRGSIQGFVYAYPGGGAPFGKAYYYANPGTFSVGGARRTFGSSYYLGAGGNWGQPGEISYPKGPGSAGSAGAPFTGTVTVSNISGGQILGKGWTS